MHEMDDRQLLAEFVRTGGSEPFAQIVRRHAAMVFGVCRSVLGNSADAEDAAQATFFTLAQKAPSLLARHPLAGWLHRVAWHVAKRARLAQQRRTAHEREAAMLASRTQPNVKPESDLLLLNQELDRLPDRYRLALILHHLQGLSEAEAARKIGCAVGTLSGRLSRGRQMLRERMTRRAGAGAIVSAAALSTLLADQLRASTVPGEFAESTSRPASLLAAGHSAAQARISSRAAALTEAAIRMLFLTRVRAAAAVILMAVLLAVGFTFSARHSFGGNEPRAQVLAGDVIGRIVDPSNQALAGATIRIYQSKAAARSNSPPIAVTRSDDAGAFSLTGMPAGRGYYVLCFKAQPVFMHAEMDGVDVAATQSNDLGTIRLVEGRYQ